MSLVRPPREIEVLCRDVVAADGTLDETISEVEELQGQLEHWVRDLRKRRAERDDSERPVRRALRRATSE